MSHPFHCRFVENSLWINNPLGTLFVSLAPLFLAICFFARWGLLPTILSQQSKSKVWLNLNWDGKWRKCTFGFLGFSSLSPLESLE